MAKIYIVVKTEVPQRHHHLPIIEQTEARYLIDEINDLEEAILEAEKITKILKGESE